jgi:NTP pyrophosphatase (non-canonical NTP hydrolase)
MNKSFSKRNRARCESTNGFYHKLNDWSQSDWMVAIIGELGEAANIVKKLNRVRDCIPGNAETPEQLYRKLENEIADVYIYLDLFCQAAGIDLEAAVNRVFDAKSKQIGYVEE